uniref:Uncharacterized protein n=1 Tax=Lepeophtheirus salmonis TaxID=72036 RepID=A0A0K2TKS1_LEPSM
MCEIPKSKLPQAVKKKALYASSMLNGLDKSESSRIQFIIGQATSKNVFQVTHLLC